MNFCPNCGAQRPAGQRYCGNCGHEFAKASLTEAPAHEAVPLSPPPPPTPVATRWAATSPRSRLLVVIAVVVIAAIVIGGIWWINRPRAWPQEARCVQHEWATVVTAFESGIIPSDVVGTLALSAETRTSIFRERPIPEAFQDTRLVSILARLPTIGGTGTNYATLPETIASYEDALNDAGVPHVPDDSCDLTVDRFD